MPTTYSSILLFFLFQVPFSLLDWRLLANLNPRYMKAIHLHNYGSEHLRYEEVPSPQTGPGQVLVRVHAASVNQIDAGKASGAARYLFPLTFPWIPGGDFAGTVEMVGAGVTDWQPGTDVYGTCEAVGNLPAYGGTYAEYIVVPAANLAVKPATLSFAEAAAVPIAALTAWQALQATQLQAGQTILIHGGAGPVGGFAVQFAHLLGARVLATASAQDLDFVRSLGAQEAIDYHTTPFETVLHQVDAVLDVVGGDTQQRSFDVLKSGGYLIATNQPPSPDEAARYGVHAQMVHMHNSGDELAHFARLLDAGTLRVDVARTYPLAQAGLAWADSARHLPPRPGAPAGPPVAAPKVHGKIVLEVG